MYIFRVLVLEFYTLIVHVDIKILTFSLFYKSRHKPQILLVYINIMAIKYIYYV